MGRRFFFLAVLTALLAAQPAAAITPNDPAWLSQRALRDLHLPDVWDLTTGDQNVIIATVDTGVNENLPDLRGALVPGWDFTDGDTAQEDLHGHGTFVATQIAARGNDGAGMAGYCWRCRVMPVRVTKGGEATPERVAAGIRWAVDHGARIINVGFSSETADAPHDTQGAAIQYARDRGVLVLVGAGNTGRDLPTFPGAFPGATPVAGVDDNGFLHPWSTRGGWVTLAAPGCQIVTAPSNDYGRLCGSSVTSPAVAGIAGLMLSVNPSLTPAQIVGALQATATPVPGIAGGRIDAFRAFEYLGLVRAAPTTGPSGPPSLPTPTPTPGTGARTAATPGASSEARIQIGRMRTRVRMSLRVATGRVRLAFTSPGAAECTMTLASPEEFIIAVPRDRHQIILSNWVQNGRYWIEIECRTARPKAYTLAITARFPLTPAR